MLRKIEKDERINATNIEIFKQHIFDPASLMDLYDLATEGIDLSIFVNNEFTKEQITAIRYAIGIYGTDVISVVTRSNLSAHDINILSGIFNMNNKSYCETILKLLDDGVSCEEIRDTIYKLEMNKLAEEYTSDILKHVVC